MGLLHTALVGLLSKPLFEGLRLGDEWTRGECSVHVDEGESISPGYELGRTFGPQVDQFEELVCRLLAQSRHQLFTHLLSLSSFPGCHDGTGIDGDASVDASPDIMLDVVDGGDVGDDAGEDPVIDPAHEPADDPAPEPSTDASDEDNCVVACLRAQWEGGRDCERLLRDCYATCETFIDDECTWDCEYDRDMCWNDLTAVAMACGEACPCYDEYEECMDTCAGSGDPDCASDCWDAYGECTRYDCDALNVCWEACFEPRLECRYSCEEYETIDDPEAYGLCNYDCMIDDIDCHVACL